MSCFDILAWAAANGATTETVEEGIVPIQAFWNEITSELFVFFTAGGSSRYWW
jgi:hypothetical protein